VEAEPLQPEQASQWQKAEQPEHPPDEIVQKEKRARQRRSHRSLVEFVSELLVRAVTSLVDTQRCHGRCRPRHQHLQPLCRGTDNGVVSLA
jgi:hypothetical protein